MARMRNNIERAAALHRQATAVAEAAAQALDQYSPEAAPAQQYAEQHELAARLRATATELTPGWLGASLEVFPPSSPLPAPGSREAVPPEQQFVRLGVAQPLDDARFPVVVPLLGAGHLAIDADARDPRTAGLLRSLVLRIIAATPAGELRIRPVDPTGVVFPPFHDLTSAGLMSAPATDRAGLRAVLAEAEEWVRRPGSSCILVVIASLPELTEGADLARIAALAQLGPAQRLHMIVAGWPPPPLTAETTQPPLAQTTQVALRNPYAVVGDPPGGTFGDKLALNAPVYLDPSPPAESIQHVCAQVAGRVVRVGASLTELLPEQPWQESSAEGLATVVGCAGDTPVSLRLSDLTPHWLVGGRSGAGKTAFLVNVLYGLSARYGPEELVLYLLDFKEGVSFTEFTPSPRDPSWIPQARAVGVESDREYGLAVLRELDAEMTARSEAYKDSGVTRFVDLRAGQRKPRIVCVIDEFQVLVQGSDRLARDAVARLESLARKGRSYGIHLILASQTTRGVESLYAKRDSIFGQFPVRVALPGGGDVLDPLNRAADPLGLGEAVINTAGGLGGPAGASRAHERMVEFPDPHAQPEVLVALRHRLWEARPATSRPPYVFAGYAPQHLPAQLPPSDRPTAYLGRVIDVPLSLAAYPFDPTPGRHLAILGPSELGADLVAAAGGSLAAQHRPGSVQFVLASFVAATAAVATQLEGRLRSGGHLVRTVDAVGLKEITAEPRLSDTYLLGFGLDVGESAGLGPLLRDGPARGVHLIGWWRGLRRFGEDTGGSFNREDVAGLVLLNVPATDAAMLLGDSSLDWQPRPNRALLHDRHRGRTELIVPFVHSGRST